MVGGSHCYLWCAMLAEDDGVITVSKGESVIIHKEDCYSIKVIDELHIIEVQIGDELIEEDIERFDWN